MRIEFLYRIVSVLGIIIRQFFLSNPFVPLGDRAEFYNWIAGALFVPLSYFMTGLFYERGSTPAVVGSVMYLLAYAINTWITHLACRAYSVSWILSVVIALLYLIGLVYLWNRKRECC